MAKKKKRASSGSSSGKSSRKKLDQGVIHQIRVLLGFLIYVFLLASVFDNAGTLGHSVFVFLNSIFGATTWLVGVYLLWYALKKAFPKTFHLAFLTRVGLLILLLGVNGMYHSLDAENVSMQVEGAGGGTIGGIASMLTTDPLGPFVGRLLLVILIIVGLMLVFNKALLPFFHLEKEENEDEEEIKDSVPVMGEIQDNKSSFGLFKKKAVRPAPVPVDVPRKPSVDSLRPAMTRQADWNYPPVSLLEVMDSKPQAGNIQKRMEQIQKTLGDFGIDVAMNEVNVGPTVTQFTLKPSEGVKLNQITARQDDMALALAAQSLRVEAPIPGKGLVGIEIPNDKKAMVGLRDILESKAFRNMPSRLALALGRDAAGTPVIADLTRMPHVLIAGATGSGKSVCINSIILTLLMNNSPDELRMILVDPKRVELTGFNGLPHLLTPVITEANDTVKALKYCVEQMEHRYKLFARTGKRNIDQYNQEPDLAEGKLPYIVLVIDELADLMMVAAREVEGSIVRLAQMARAVGIHLIVATQRPSVDVITGLIKANIPTRLAFAVASQIDSRTILDMSGAEKLLGYGDMLYVSTEIGRPKRVQGVLATEKEITAIIAHIKMQEVGDRYDPAVLETRIESRLGSSRENGEIDDNLFEEAYEVVKQAGKASSTLLQTRLSIGYARAARLMQALEDKGMIGPANGSKPREVYGSLSGSNDDIDGRSMEY